MTRQPSRSPTCRAEASKRTCRGCRKSRHPGRQARTRLAAPRKAPRPPPQSLVPHPSPVGASSVPTGCIKIAPAVPITTDRPSPGAPGGAEPADGAVRALSYTEARSLGESTRGVERGAFMRSSKKWVGPGEPPAEHLSRAAREHPKRRRRGRARRERSDGGALVNAAQRRSKGVSAPHLPWVPAFGGRRDCEDRLHALEQRHGGCDLRHPRLSLTS